VGGNRLHCQWRYPSGHAGKGHTRPSWPGRAHTRLAHARKASAGMLQDKRCDPSQPLLRPPPPPRWRHPSFTQARRDEPHMGPKGPGSGLRGNRPAALLTNHAIASPPSGLLRPQPCRCRNLHQWRSTAARREDPVPPSNAWGRGAPPPAAPCGLCLAACTVLTREGRREAGGGTRVCCP
jgi:hypothetical protein